MKTAISQAAVSSHLLEDQLGIDLAMFVKISIRPTLVDTYEEAEKVEAKTESIDQ